MSDSTETNHPLPPPTTISVRVLQPRRGSSSTTGSRSRTTSRASSRAASLRPPDLAPDSDVPASARDSIHPLSGPVKREHSPTDDVGGGPAPEASPPPTLPFLLPHEQQDILSSPKRRRLDTDSVEDLLAATDVSYASSSLLAEWREPEIELELAAEPQDPYPNETTDENEGGTRSRSHTAEPPTHVGQPIGLRDDVETPDADFVLEQEPQEAEAEAEFHPAHAPPPSSASSQTSAASGLDNLPAHDPVSVPPTTPTASPSEPETPKPPPRPQGEPLGSYNCPICFSAPRNATLTPCGHVCCGECLFTAVKTTIERSQFHGPASEHAK